MRDLIIRLYERLHDAQSPIYEDSIYVPVGIALILCTVATGVIYYLILNGFRARFSKRWPHWWACLFVNLVIAFLAPILIVWNLSDENTGYFGSDTLLLCLINALYSVVLFFLVSMALKWWSPHARRTPF